MQEIYLKVKNVQSLDTNSVHWYIFNQKGGSIGSGSDNAWIINDKSNQIQNIQALINYEEGIFGLKPYSKECKIFLNDSFSPLPSSYETEIKLGDYFKIGELEIEITTKDALQEEQNKTQSLSELGELPTHNQLDQLEVQSKGAESGFHLEEKEVLSLNKEQDDILGLSEFEQSNPSTLTQEGDYYVSSKNIEKFISTKAQELQDALHSKQKIKLDREKLRMIDLQSRLQHFSLLENKETINLLILSTLCKSLHNPIFESICPDYFEKSVSEILEECINGNAELLQKSLLAYLILEHKAD